MATQRTRARRLASNLVPARTLRLIAIIAGLVGLLLCGLTPLLPVKQTTAAVLWPQGVGPDGLITDVTAPLVSGAPLALDATIPCQAISTLPAAGGVVLSTIPDGGIDAGRNGLFVRATADSVIVAFRDSVAAVAPRQAVSSGACSALHVWADVGGVGADFVGIPGATGTLAPEKKPQVAGVFTDMKVAAQAGLSARIDVDTRFVTAPTALKTALMVLGVLATIASIVALAVLDRRRGPHGCTARGADSGASGSRPGWPTVSSSGPCCCGTSSVPSRRTTATTSPSRGCPATRAMPPTTTATSAPSEAPFDWYQSVLAHLAAVSTASVWMRLPALIAGLATWVLLSRWVIPRLGRRLAVNRVAVWTGAAVFLASWLPFNNGLRPEPLIAFAVLAAWVLVEYSIGARRLWPAAAAIIVAMFSVTLAPQGLIALAPLLVGARGIYGIARDRRAGADGTGVLAPLATYAASLSLVFVIVFRDQTLATVAESARIKYTVGPTISWYQEFLRYYFLTVKESVDGSLTRRFAVFALLLCLFGLLAVLLRRGSLPGMVTATDLASPRHDRHRSAAADVHPHQVGRAVRRVRRARRRARRRHRLHVLPRRTAQSAQPRALRHRAAVHPRLGDRGHQRLVLRRQLRRAVVRQAAGARRLPGDLDVPRAGDRDRCARRLAALPHGLRRTHRGRRTPAATGCWPPPPCWWWRR